MRIIRAMHPSPGGLLPPLLRTVRNRGGEVIFQKIPKSGMAPWKLIIGLEPDATLSLYGDNGGACVWRSAGTGTFDDVC
jgi:hypothetical protein